MKAIRPGNILWAMAAVALLAGAGLSVQTAGIVGETGARVERKRRDLERLRVLEAEVKRGEDARRAIEKMPARSAEALLPLVQSQFADYKAEDCRETRRDLAPGWMVRQTELSFNEVPFAGVAELVRKTEALQPPWRLAKCILRASPVAPGTGQAVIQLEAVQRKD